MDDFYWPVLEVVPSLLLIFHWLVLIHRTHLSAIQTVTFGLAMCPGEEENRDLDDHLPSSPSHTE